MKLYSSFAIVSSALVVRAVIEFFGSGTFVEPVAEADAVAVIQQWNDWSDNPLGIQAGDIILKTDPDAVHSGFRGRNAGVGYIWNPDLQFFVAPRPYPSWILNVQTDKWEAPIPRPNDGKLYLWNEETQTWDEQP